VKEENQLKSKLTKLVQEIEAVQEENGEDGVNVELNSQLFIRLIELLEKYLKKYILIIIILLFIYFIVQCYDVHNT